MIKFLDYFPRQLPLLYSAAFHAGFAVAELRRMGATTHVVQSTTGRRSAVDGRTTRHPGYLVSQRQRKLVEQGFGWMKTIGSRGDVTIWLSEDAIAAWIPPKNGLRGGQRRYSNLAIRTTLTLRVVFGLPLRQTEGFLDSLLSLMSRDLKAPDHTTLSRRNQIVVVPPLTRAHDGPIDLIVDSTGLKILGRGEWNAHKHKTSKKRRDWRKLHIGVDAEGFIVAAELTASGRDDASTLPDLLAPLEVPIRRFTADGAYDHRS